MLIVFQLQREQKYNDETASPEKAQSAFWMVQRIRHFQVPQFSLLELTATSLAIMFLLIRHQSFQHQVDARRFEKADGSGAALQLL